MLNAKRVNHKYLHSNSEHKTLLHSVHFALLNASEHHSTVSCNIIKTSFHNLVMRFLNISKKKKNLMKPYEI